MKRNNPKNLIVPFITFKSTKKDKILLECVVCTSTAKHILKGVLVTKRKLKSDVNTILDLITVEKHVDNNIQIFLSLMMSDMKNINTKYSEDSAWAKCLKLYDKKKSSTWFCLVCQKIIATITDSVVCKRY